ncbi:LiaF domain-containing protein [Winogradskya humida]|uniref:Cell wall-active antibiotic response 4TMS protein YvqF n=1 Tax=Winogradskya humida TaxID=113566 RepID=A0ABQ4A3T5_9ACTN|nr:LiaF domain-containing protein [Actinoplanes humidus]GIE25510.1 hypothetical protein Ahu01nite_086120 [Actinoplanes humidus]
MDATDSPLFTRRDGSAWFVNVLGGLKRGGAWRMPRDMWFVSLIGGANLDLTAAELPERPVLSKVSLVGGVSLVLPQDVAVEVEGFRLFGGVRVQAGTVAATRTLKIREYSVAGGVHVRRG